MTLKVCLASIAVLVLCAPDALGAQLLVLDTGDYDHLGDNSVRNLAAGRNHPELRGSHAYFTTTTEARTNWAAPVDYRAGTEYVVVDVLSKPTDTELRLMLCMDDFGVSCVEAATVAAPGRYTFSQTPGRTYSVSPDYTKGFRVAAVILKDAQNRKLDPGQGFIGEVKDDPSASYARYFPLRMRVRAWLVSPGAAFEAPTDTMGDDAVDAGAPPADSSSSVSAGPPARSDEGRAGEDAPASGAPDATSHGRLGGSGTAAGNAGPGNDDVAWTGRCSVAVGLGTLQPDRSMGIWSALGLGLTLFLLRRQMRTSTRRS